MVLNRDVSFLDILRKNAKVRKDNADGRMSSSVLKIVKDLKLVIDQQRIDDPRSAKKENRESRDDPLKRFFIDEVSTTRQLLRLVRYDLDSFRSADDLKVMSEIKKIELRCI